MFDRFNEKCVFIDFLPGSMGHFIQKLLYEVTHDMHDLQPTNTGSCHYNSQVTRTLPSVFDIDFRRATIATFREHINANSNLEENFPVKTLTDNVIRFHSFGYHEPLLNLLPNSKLISITNSSSREYVASMLFLIMKHSIEFHPSNTKLGIVDAYSKSNTQHLANLKIGRNQVRMSNTEEFTNVSNVASRQELLYLAYQISQIFIPGLDLNNESKPLKFYKGCPKTGFSDRVIELKFEWLLTCNSHEVIKVFEKVIEKPLTDLQRHYVKTQLFCYRSSQIQEIIDDPFEYIRYLKTVYDKVESFYQSERAVNKNVQPQP